MPKEIKETVASHKSNEENNYYQNTYLWHVEKAKEIDKWWDIRQYLIEEIHRKKSVKKSNGLFKPLGETREYYIKYLFFGQRYQTSFSFFPCNFKGMYDDILLTYTPNTHGLKDIASQVYYHKDFKYNDLFNTSEWKLSEGLDMTNEDRGVMEKFRKGFLSFIHNAVQDAIRFEKIRNREYVSMFKKFLTKIEKVMDVS